MEAEPGTQVQDRGNPAAAFIVGQSVSLPIRIPTIGFDERLLCIQIAFATNRNKKTQKLVRAELDQIFTLRLDFYQTVPADVRRITTPQGAISPMNGARDVPGPQHVQSSNCGRVSAISGTLAQSVAPASRGRPALHSLALYFPDTQHGDGLEPPYVCYNLCRFK